MFGKILGAVVGNKMAQNTSAIGGTTGALLGAATPFALRALSVPALVAVGVGGYFAKKHFDKTNNAETKSAKKSASAKTSGSKSKK